MLSCRLHTGGLEEDGHECLDDHDGLDYDGGVDDDMYILGGGVIV